jgi:hypothetical protein
MATDYSTQKVKPASDAYTGMLAVSLAALLIGIGAIYLDYSRYTGQPPKLSTTFTEPVQREALAPKGAPADEGAEDKGKEAPKLIP